MQTSDDSSTNVSVNKIPRHTEMFSEDVQDLVTSDKSNEGDDSVGNIRNLGQLKPGRQYDRLKLLLFNNLIRCLPLEVAVPMMHVMIELEIPGLGSEVAITPKPLDSEETAIIGVIEAFDRSITPGFSYGDKYGFDSQGETKSEYDSEGSRVTVAPTESQLVVELEKIGHSQSLPASDQSLGDGLIVFGSLRMKEDAMTVEIHDIEGKESAIVLDIAGTDQIGLVDGVASQGVPEIGIRHSFGGIRRFF
jgi:hypothetical protein